MRSGRSVAVIAVLAALVLPGSALAGGPGVWTKLDSLDNSSDTAGMLRTSNGVLHLVWLTKKAANNTQSYRTAAIALGGKLVGTGTAVSGWNSLEQDPQLVPAPGGMRLVFEGSTGNSGCYFNGGVFTALSTNGFAWFPVIGSMSSHTVGIGGLAATAELNGTPVAAFGQFSLFHVGVDPNCPASTPDGSVPVAPGNAPSNWAMATDTKDGSVWVANYQAFSKQGYFVDRLLPTQGPLTEAPGSATTAAHTNQPIQPVALAARQGGGIFMAYCAASSTEGCAHIDLWKVGSPKPKVVPGSAHLTGARVAIAAGLQGRISVAWYDGSKNVIHVVRTNTAATAFGGVRTIKPPPSTSFVTTLQVQGTFGRLDTLVVEQPSNSSPLALYHTQILSGLSLSAKPSSFSHKNTTKVTFTVKDAGQPIKGASVSCIGHKGKTSAAGTVKLTFKKGTPKGKHVCTAARVNYAVGKVTIKVT